MIFSEDGPGWEHKEMWWREEERCENTGFASDAVLIASFCFRGWTMWWMRTVGEERKLTMMTMWGRKRAWMVVCEERKKHRRTRGDTT